MVAISKTDLPITRERLKKDIDILEEKGIEVFAFSAVTGEGVAAVLGGILQRLDKVRHPQT